MSIVRDKMSRDYGLSTSKNDVSALKSPSQFKKGEQETLRDDFKKLEGSRRTSTQ